MQSGDPALRRLGEGWKRLLDRDVRWKMACEREFFLQPGEAGQRSIFSDEALFEAAVRKELPAELKELPLKFDPARHVLRPSASAAAAGQNFLYDSATDQIRSLDDRELFRQIPLSTRICRIFAEDSRHNAELAAAMDRLSDAGHTDDVTNM